MYRLWRILALDRDFDSLPAHPRIAWQTAIDSSVQAVLLRATTSHEQWQAAAARLSPSALIATLGPAPSYLTPDIVCSDLASPTLDDLLAKLVSIQAKVDELPPIGHSRDAEKLAVLALAYTRGIDIHARRSALTPATVNYTLLHGRPRVGHNDLRATLEFLASLELLQRRFAARVATCSACASGRVSAFESCVACGSGDLIEESLLHHYRCGFQDGEGKFVSGQNLVCPKCRHELRHFGVDYGRPGTVVRCRDCHQAMTEPHPRFHCLDCGTETRGEDVEARDWHHYALTEAGLAALRAGALPDFGVPRLGDHLPRTHPWRDFTLLVGEQVRVAARYRRRLAVGHIRLTNLGTLRQQQGAQGSDETLRLFAQIIVENLRDTDFVSVPADDALIIAMPETDTAQAQRVLDRIAAAAASKLAFRLQLTCRAVGGDASGALLDQVGPDCQRAEKAAA